MRPTVLNQLRGKTVKNYTKQLRKTSLGISTTLWTDIRMKRLHICHVTQNEFKSVNYVVSRRTNDAVGDTISGWDAYKSKENEILEATFSTRATSLAKRIDDVEKRFGPFLKKDGFRALAVLRCGYAFVWYELGYRYFPADYATRNHTLFTQSGNKYSDKCGQIVFFP
ncbi:hypothetical protein AAVH_26144 [Aphelenchoides avenae]|nr:hypothetical protein AAVH_26144 [Aphelenchus avenae]